MTHDLVTESASSRCSLVAAIHRCVSPLGDVLRACLGRFHVMSKISHYDGEFAVNGREGGSCIHDAVRSLMVEPGL